jgi:aspartyl/asparaginyl beta-hydroxylase (cupin superfamily)
MRRAVECSTLAIVPIIAMVKRGAGAVGGWLWTNLSFLPLAPLLLHTAACWIFLDRRRYFDPAEYPELSLLVERYPEIRAEYDAARAAMGDAEPPAVTDIDPGQLRLDPTKRWHALILRAFGRDVNGHRDQFPVTAATIDAIPGLYMAFFSVLEPGGALTPHRGHLKGILRVHLGLHVPPGAGVEVGGERREWREGELLVFDDTFRHWVWNPSDTDRVVLFCDLVRPIPQPWLRRANERHLESISRSRRVQHIVAAA